MNTSSARPSPEADFDEDFWRDRFPTEPYVKEGDTFDDYGPAFRYGTSLRREVEDFESNEDRIRERWEKEKGHSRLDWNRARLAVKIAWYQDDEFATAKPEELFKP
jgi:hypothetical protein